VRVALAALRGWCALIRVIDHEDALAEAIDSIRSYGSCFVLGAGMSAGNFPMTAQLPALLWHAIDQDPQALAELRIATGKSGHAKSILSQAGVELAAGWQILRQSATARRIFQHGFAAVDEEREPSDGHRALARLIDAGHVQVVVSYNWDTCLERAFQALFGVPLPAGVLYKPHGDVARPDDEWVLPDEDGKVPSTVHDAIAAASAHPRAFVIVGYSESDSAVVEALLNPLEQRWPVVRVGPSATGEGAVRGPADEVVGAIADALAADGAMAGWKYVDFSRSRNFAAALRAERLRPADVDACPELPSVVRLADRLLTSRFATLAGPSGSGKSITAFQAARRLNLAGWRVVELRRTGVADTADVTAFARLPGPVVAVVDDAQALGAELVADLTSYVDDDHALLLVSTERLEAREGEALVAERAVAVLHDYCRSHINEVGPLLTQLDDRVQLSQFFETPLQRLEASARTATSPWLYMFVASGGERRIGGFLERYAAEPATALAFAFVCIAQFTSRDAGVTPDVLATMADRFAKDVFAGEDGTVESEVTACLARLASDRLITESGTRIRASHIRVADHALRVLAAEDVNHVGAIVRRAVRGALLDPLIEVTGKLWLIGLFHLSDKHRFRYKFEIVDQRVSHALIEECLLAAPGRDRGAALRLVWSSELLCELDDAFVKRLAEAMSEWLPNMVSDEALGFQSMLSSIRMRNERVHVDIARAVPASLLGRQLSSEGQRWAAMYWMQVINELRPDNASPELLAWCEEFEHAIVPESIERWLGQRDERSGPYEVFELIDGMVGVSPKIAQDIFRSVAQELKDSLEADLVEAITNFDWWFGWMMVVALIADAPSASGIGVTERSGRVDRADAYGQSDVGPEPRDAGVIRYAEAREQELESLAASVLDVMADVNWAKATASLKRKALHEITNVDLMFGWLSQLSTSITDEIARVLSEDWLMGLVAEARADTRRTRGAFDVIAQLLYHLSFGDDGAKVVRRLVEARISEVDVFPDVLVSRLPDLAATEIRKGGNVEMHVPHGSDWRRLAEDVAHVAAVDRGAAIQWLRKNLALLTPKLATPQANELPGFSAFAAVADGLDSGILDGAMKSVDIEHARSNWRAHWQSSEALVRPICERARTVPGPIAGLAEAILAEPVLRGEV